MLPGGWLFPGQNPVNPHQSTRQLNRWCSTLRRVAPPGLDKRVSLHTLRHSFATHLLEQKVDIRVIQVLLGHKKIESTAGYSQVATRTLCETTSPLESLTLRESAARLSGRAAASPGGRGPLPRPRGGVASRARRALSASPSSRRWRPSSAAARARSADTCCAVRRATPSR